jgi:hypothetical protein
VNEDELNDFVSKAHLNKAISNIHVEIKQDGLVTTAHLSKGPLDFDVAQKGRLFVDPNSGNMALKIDSIKAGMLPLPPQVLRNLEEEFADNISEQTFTVQILEINYQPGAVIVTARWNAHGTSAAV